MDRTIEWESREMVDDGTGKVKVWDDYRVFLQIFRTSRCVRDVRWMRVSWIVDSSEILRRRKCVVFVVF